MSKKELKEAKKKSNIEGSGGVDLKNAKALMDQKIENILQRYKMRVGFEFHVQINTKAKLFSTSPNMSNEEPNTMTNFVDIAIPGSLPVFNDECLGLALRASVAFGGEISKQLQFDRKHYFYQDLP
jgi:aspartyl-tRNA(Asn)/glutamyl-tRNA(Gln) amidotransferase subunit B